MKTTYKKLWKLLIDREMTKSDLRERAGISSASIAKLGKGENVSMSVLLKICATLDCDIGDIVETVKAGNFSDTEAKS
ncbi:MAG: helix-turn-helix transcriptional regulator [Victivallales bacterium]|nr:helix-turn-helix transcriptional regulator [Victivallales bacterium]